MLIVARILYLLAAWLFAYGAWYTNEGVNFLQQESLKNASSTTESDLIELLIGFSVAPAMAGASVVCLAKSFSTTSPRPEMKTHHTEQQVSS